MQATKQAKGKPAKKIEQRSLFEGVAARRARRTVPETEWARHALSSQGDVVLAAMLPVGTVETDHGTGSRSLDIDAILRSLRARGYDFERHQIRAGLKNLLERKEIKQEGHFFLVKVAPKVYV